MLQELVMDLAQGKTQDLVQASCQLWTSTGSALLVVDGVDSRPSRLARSARNLPRVQATFPPPC